MLELAAKSAGRALRSLQEFVASGLEPVVAAARVIVACLAEGGKVLIFGNGGSAADAQHLSAELIGRFVMDRPALPAIALNTDTSVLTALANDYGYDQVFAKQIRGLGRRGDIALGISTSGTSPNVLVGLKAARDKGLATIGLSNAGGGGMSALCDHIILAPSLETARVQEVHGLVIHLWCELIDAHLFGAKT